MLIHEQHQLSIPSKTENLFEVERMIQEVCEHCEAGEENFGNILIAVTEAVNNAIFHGNINDPNKLIQITCSGREHELFFSVEDEGKGFDPSQVPDPTAPENIEKPNGRGIFLMKHLADKVEFKNNGKKVELSFHLN
jgi:serine/threonine-protein kinase RsbW